MKATGIVRRIDDLGRVVIPKEIRRTMRIQEGDPMEIIIHDSMVCFKKYNFYETPNDILKELQNAITDIGFDLPADKRNTVFNMIDGLKELLKDDNVV